MKILMKGIWLCIVLCAIILDQGCEKSPNNIDPEFQPYYDNFIQDADNNGVSLDPDQGMTIQFGKTSDDSIVGFCVGSGYGNGTITILESYWYFSTEVEKKILIYHELGHCVLAEKHTDNINEIMYPYIRSELLPNMIPDLFRDEGDQKN